MCYHHLLCLSGGSNAHGCHVRLQKFLNKFYLHDVFTVIIFSYVSSNPSLTSETYHYKKGSGQTFCQPSHTFNPSILAEDQLSYNMERELCPVAIHCVAEEPTDGDFPPKICDF